MKKKTGILFGLVGCILVLCILLLRGCDLEMRQGKIQEAGARAIYTERDDTEYIKDIWPDRGSTGSLPEQTQDTAEVTSKPTTSINVPDSKEKETSEDSSATQLPGAEESHASSQEPQAEITDSDETGSKETDDSNHSDQKETSVHESYDPSAGQQSTSRPVEEQAEGSGREEPGNQDPEGQDPEPQEHVHLLSAEVDVLGNGMMFRSACSCGAWKCRSAITEQVEYWWVSWRDEEGNSRSMEFSTYEACAAFGEELGARGILSSWGNDYKVEIIGWAETCSEDY